MENKALRQLNKFKAYVFSLPIESREKLAQKCGTSYWFLRNVMYGSRKPNAKLSVKIEQYTNGLITRKDLRPDDWAEIWPELDDK